MAGLVTFDPAAWKARYPEFSAVADGTAQLYFNEATLYCHNRLGPVPDIDQLTVLLNMMTAHVAALAGAGTGNSGSTANKPVGRLSGATEGSVSAQFDNQYPPGSAQYFQQTQYGAAYWAATAIYRTFRYRPGVRALPAIPGYPFPWVYPSGNG